MVICEAPLEPEALAEASVELPELLEAVSDDDESVVGVDELSVEVVALASVVGLEEPTVVSAVALPAPTAGSTAPEAAVVASVVAPVAGAVVAVAAEPVAVAAEPVAVSAEPVVVGPVAGVATGAVLAADWPLAAAMAMAAMTRTWTNFIVVGSLGRVGWDLSA